MYYEDKPADSTMDLDESHDAAHDDKASDRSAKLQLYLAKLSSKQRLIVELCYAAYHSS